MKKTILLIITLLISTSLFLNGTETRIAALGSEEELLIDDINVFNYPSSLEYFVERVIVEYGFYPYSDSFAYFSLLKEMGKFGNIGLVLNKTGIPDYPATSSSTMIKKPVSLFNILYSLKINENFTVGISGGYGISASNIDEEGTANDVTNESCLTSGKVSVSYFWGEAEHLLEIAGGMHQYEFSYKLGDNFSFNNNNNASIDSKGRFFYNLNDYLSIIPFFDYYKVDMSSIEKMGSAIREIERETTKTRTGIGINLSPFEENRLVVGLIYNSTILKKSSANFDSTITDKSMPAISAGIESELKSWFTVRAGITKSFLIHKTESSNGIKSVLTDKTAPFKLNAGLGIRVASLEIDAILNEDLPFTHGYFISGEKGNIFTKVSATYLF